MGSSLRDLMRREKESRKRSSTDSCDSNNHKVQKTSPSGHDKLKNDNKFEFKESLSLHSDDKPAETTQLPSDFFDQPTQHTDALTGLQTEKLDDGSDHSGFKIQAPLNLNKDIELKPQFNPRLLEEPREVDVLEETYEVLDDEPEQSEPISKTVELNDRSLNESHEGDKSHGPDVFDENRLVYEQLNTAYCSNFEFEHDKILMESGIDAAGEIADAESDEDLGDSKSRSVITSSNFGTSKISVSASEKLPVGFFDDQNVDAKARGKLTAKEARDKMRELSRKRSRYLNEAKYIQEKYVEAHREKMKMESDKVQHDETLKELQDKLSKIKGELAVDAAELKVDPDGDASAEQVLDQYADLNYDDLSWMSRSIV